MKCILLVCFAPCFFFGCKVEKKDSFWLTFNISEKANLLLSGFIEEVNLIELETVPESYLKDIRQVEIFEDFLLVKDIRPELFVFDMEGRFVRTIGKKGAGPGEYQYCLQFALDYENRKIFLKTNVGIMVYDILGNFIEKYPLQHVTNLFYANNHFYSFSHLYLDGDGTYYEHTYLSVYDSSFNIIDSTRIYTYESNVFTIRGFPINVIQDKEDIYIYYPGYQDDVKQIKDTLYVLDRGQLQPFLGVELTHAQEDRINKIFPSGRYVVVSYNRYVEDPALTYLRSYPSQCIYDRKTNTAYHAKDGFLDDIYNKGHVILRPLLKQGMFYAVMEEDFSEELKGEPNPSIYIGTFKK